jgi:ribosomal-protein-alanine N-acetyltransferase
MMMRNCAEAFLEVRISNVMAIDLYKVLGFEIKSRMERYYNDGEIAYSMSLNLEEPK